MRSTLACNWINYRMIEEDGYGRFGVRMVRALMRAGVRVTPSLSQVLTDLPGDLLRMTGLDFSRLTISLMPPHELRPVAGRQWLFTMYEATRLRKGWINAINNYAERVLVPAPWLLDVLESHDCTVPAHVIPGGIDPAEFPLVERPIDERPYTFLCLGDRGSRKGWDIAWQAFYQAFGEQTDVRLVIKARARGMTWGDKVRLDLTNSDKRVSAWRQDVRSMADVYAAADCFVFPTRAEGYGLPPREAAATGMPVICTAWSGTEPHIDEWALPVRNYRMVNASIEAEPSRDGTPAQWAYANVDEVADLMRWCYEHRDEAAQKGRDAARWLRANETWDHAAAKLIRLMEGYDDGADSRAA